eukprot:Rmarinus@m.26293
MPVVILHHVVNSTSVLIQRPRMSHSTTSSRASWCPGRQQFATGLTGLGSKSGRRFRRRRQPLCGPCPARAPSGARSTVRGGSCVTPSPFWSQSSRKRLWSRPASASPWSLVGSTLVA